MSPILVGMSRWLALACAVALMDGCARPPEASLPSPPAPAELAPGEAHEPAAPEPMGALPPWSPAPASLLDISQEHCRLSVVEAPDYGVFPDWRTAVQDLFAAAQWQASLERDDLEMLRCQDGACPETGELVPLGLPDSADFADGMFGSLFIPLGDGEVLRLGASLVGFREYHCLPELFGERASPDHARLVLLTHAAEGHHPERGRCELEVDEGCSPACFYRDREGLELVRVGERWFEISWWTDQLDGSTGLATEPVRVRLEPSTGVTIEGCGVSLAIEADTGPGVRSSRGGR